MNVDTKLAAKAALEVEGFFDPATYTITYVLWDAATSKAAIVDPVLDYDAASGRTSTASADKVAAFVDGHDLEVEFILETHVHADHLTAAPYLKDRLGGESRPMTGIGRHVTTVQSTFGALFNAGDEFARDGRQFDCLFDDGDVFAIGGLSVRVMHTPGHTPACITYLAEDGTGAACAFVGDTLFMPDYGTARCDFPGGDAAQLYRSIRAILALPDEAVLYMCHDYGGDDRDYEWVTSVAAQKAGNVHIREGIGEAEFTAMRQARDAQLSMPALILPSVQVNMRAGAFPPAEDNGVNYLKIPVNAV